MVKCIHCGQMINPDTGLDPRGSEVCGDAAADWDMRDQPHDYDLGLT